MGSLKSFSSQHWRARWYSYRSWSKSRRGLVLEALCMLGLCRFLVRYVSFNLTASRMLGWFMAETVKTLDSTDAEVARDVGWIVERMADNTLWESACLPQAMAAQNMLKRRGISSTLYLGLNTQGRHRPGQEAHAWLRCGEFILTGESEMGDFQSVACYAQDVFGAYREPIWLDWLAQIWTGPKNRKGPRPYLAPE